MLPYYDYEIFSLDMNFQSLANELILDLFEYLNTIELLLTFHGLNLRFNQLLYLHLQKSPLDFRSISKQDFDQICQVHLPFITNQILSLHFSNEDDTPGLPNLFFSYGFHFQQFIHLQSLSLYHLRSIDLIDQIIINSPHLIYLNIIQCNFVDNVEEMNICIKNIWNLTKLRSCYLNDFFVSLMTITSSSLQYLSLENYPLSFKGMIALFQSTPNLQNLNIEIHDFTDNEPFFFILPLLTKLTIDFRGELNTLTNLLKNLPNLLKLIIKIQEIYIDGYQWEELISNDLPKLKVFRLLMNYKFDETKNFEEEIEQFIQSYQTKFWIEEHQWFIQCDYHTESRIIHLYTLPYGFKEFRYYITNMSRSTCLINKNSHSSNYVNTLILYNSILPLTLEFPKISHLEISFPFDETLWSLIPKLHRLKSLEIISNVHLDESNQSINYLRSLFDQTRYLYSLTIDYLILSQLAMIQIPNQSLRRLDLLTNDGHFYGRECLLLIQALLGQQCEVLLINVENRSIVLDLIEKISNLRALTFQCQDDQWGDSNEGLINEDELIQWLKNRLPPNCVVMRDEIEVSVIRLWIQ